ncbi:hypothetical protein GW17_00049467, partial [Ensete ventricosum]
MSSEESTSRSHEETEEDGSQNKPSESTRACDSHRGRWLFGWALDPCTKWVREWNRIYLLACALGLMVDPLFFYTLSVSGALKCVFVDGWFAVTVTALRCMIDGMHVWNIWLQLKMAYGAKRSEGEEEGEKGGGGNFMPIYVKSKRGFFLDLFVVLPVMQIVTWVGAPALLRRGATTTGMTVFLITFLFEYLPKIYHSVCVLRRMQNFSGYVFGTIWWGIALNLMAYFVASHAVGACWYLLGIQRAEKCLRVQCSLVKGCGPKTMACMDPIYYGAATRIRDETRLDWAKNLEAKATCLDSSDHFQYGAYKWTVSLVTNTNRLEKILLPIFWGLMTLRSVSSFLLRALSTCCLKEESSSSSSSSSFSTFGNLESTTEWLEIVFNIIIITSGLILVTMLIGNIKVFLHATTSKKQAMHLRIRSVEWWMKRRNLSQGIRQRVRQYERQRWAATRGVDESEMIQNFPEGLRRDIKYHLCLDLVRQIAREGDPVRRMLFIVRGHLQSSQALRDGIRSCCMLGPGNFSGDELLSWCLRRPFVERLPPSSSTLVTLEATEAFGLEAADVKYVTQHFRYTFTNEKVKR